jgi:hypothetical protein
MIEPKKVKKLSDRIGRNLNGHSVPNVGAALATIMVDFLDTLPMSQIDKHEAINCIAGDAKALIDKRNLNDSE